MNRKGFTLVELLAIVILLGMVFGIVYPNVVNQIEKNEENINKYTLELIYNAADRYIKKYGMVEKGSIYCIGVSTLNEENLIPVDVDKYNDKIVEIKVGKNGINSKKISNECSKMITITYDANGGTINPATQEIKSGSKLELPTPTRDNYTFLGWYDKRENGKKITRDTILIDSIRIYAHWHQN